MLSATNVTYPSDVIVDETQENIISYDGGASIFGDSQTWLDSSGGMASPRDYLLYNDTYVSCAAPICLANFTFTGTRIAVYGVEWTGTPQSTYTLEGPGYSSTAMRVNSNSTYPRFSVLMFRSEELPYATYLLKINATGSHWVWTDPYMLDWIEYNVSSTSQSAIPTTTTTTRPEALAKAVVPRGLVAGYVVGSLLVALAAALFGVMLWRRMRYSKMEIESEHGEDKESRSGRLDLLDHIASSPNGRPTQRVFPQAALPVTGARDARSAASDARRDPLPVGSMTKPSHGIVVETGGAESNLQSGEASALNGGTEKRPGHGRVDDFPLNPKGKGKGKATEKELLSEGRQGSGSTADALPVYEP